jgi:putative hydrolase of the HAD superfamily
MGSQKKLVLLDLDNTLWDFDANAQEALAELFHRHQLHLRTQFSVHEFISTYQEINQQYWKKYEEGSIAKEQLRTQRFTDTFIRAGIPQTEHPESFWDEYLSICPMMTRLIPGAIQFLASLHADFNLGLITNGFDKTQNLKITHSGIAPHIDFMITSETFKMAKPHKEIFLQGLVLGNSDAADTVYLGDTWESDILGAVNAGINVLWFNRHLLPVPQDTISNNPHFQGTVSNLIEAEIAIRGLLEK